MSQSRFIPRIPPLSAIANFHVRALTWPALACPYAFRFSVAQEPLRWLDSRLCPIQ